MACPPRMLQRSRCAHAALTPSELGLASRGAHRDLPDLVGGCATLRIGQRLQPLPFAGEIVKTLTAGQIARVTHAQTLDVFEVGQTVDECGAYNHKDESAD